MAPNDLETKLSEQWRLVKEVPVPYITGLIVLGFLMFGVFQWAYGRVIDQKDADIEALKGQLQSVKDSLADLRLKSANHADSPAVSAPTSDPDALYQTSSVVAHVEGGKIDRARGSVYFDKIIGDADLNINAPMLYRGISIDGCQFLMGYSHKRGGEVSDQAFEEVTCQISYPHP